MKNIILISCLAFAQIVVSQNSSGTADLKSAEIVNSTALSLLDNTAAVIISNPDSKDFSVNTENLSNISFDFSLNKGKLSGLEYYGLGKNTSDFKRVTSDKLLKPYISGVLNKNDSIANFAVGISVNIVTIFRAKKQDMIDGYQIMRNAADVIAKKADEIMVRDYPNLDRITNTNEYNLQRVKIMDSLPSKKLKEFPEILKHPFLMLDFASAYSVLYPAKTYKTSQPDRLGIWSTLTISPKLIGANNYLNFYGFIRYLEDKAVYNKTNLNYNDQFKYFDFGGKIQFDFNDLSIGYEYIKRNGDGKDYRSVGLIQYKVNTDVYLTGGFGKNFTSDADKDLVTLFGIRWGVNSKDKRDWATK